MDTLDTPRSPVDIPVDDERDYSTTHTYGGIRRSYEQPVTNMPAREIARDTPQAHLSAVSWGAVFAGAAAAAAMALILLLLGTGMGLSSVSPWVDNGIGAKTFGIAAILWLTLTQLFASGLGGYIAGRLRTRWFGAQRDEVYFRDTAHGFLSWAVATLLTAALLTSTIGAIVSGGVKTGAAVATAGGAAIAGTAAARPDITHNVVAYYVDSLFRRNLAGATPTTTVPTIPPAVIAEVTRIYASAISAGSAMPRADVQYLGQIVAQYTGLGQQDAERRVADIYAQMQTRFQNAETAAKQVADEARKTSAKISLWLFISLLMGAFIASVTAIYGGRQRDL